MKLEKNEKQTLAGILVILGVLALLSALVKLCIFDPVTLIVFVVVGLAILYLLPDGKGRG